VAGCGLSTNVYAATIVQATAEGARITKIGIFAAAMLAAAGASWAGEAWAVDPVPTATSPATAASAPKPCANLPDFIATNCLLTWRGITLYGAIDAGAGWQSHDAPFDPRSAAGASYLIQRMNRSPRWSLAPGALSQSSIGIKGTEPIGGSFSFVFA
jgi:hypothetical protein